jgi:hypothetical protein
MEDLGIEELKQLINFYRQKSSDLEFNLLQTQLKLNRINSFNGSVEPEQAVKSVADKKIKHDL